MVITTRDAWRRVQELCEALESVPTEQHAEFLRTIEPDETLRTSTLSLLAAVTDEEQVQQQVARAAMPAAPPDWIGVYRIVERLGAGGSGDVFRAIRTVNGIEHPVALKRFHPHRSGREQLAGFAREQQMLVALTHPDIVRFIDAGLSDDGRPFLVMELAEGEPITAYCDRERLKLSERLRLFQAVCDAVQAAHRHLIIHLDLKPSNVLATAGGRVKLLDFGTAKLLNPAMDVTGTRSLTLLYASPEQLRGDPVSVASDIYSLGLILYELVSGSWPFRRPDTIITLADRAAGRSTAQPLDRGVTPESAALRGVSADRLRRSLRGDLDAICRKAIAHDPAHRYASASDLAEDLRRLESGEPVRAHAISVGYRFGKFVRRHAWGVAAGAILVAGLSAAAFYSASQARAARLAAARSDAENNFLTGLFNLTGQDAGSRSGMTVRELLTLADTRTAPKLGGDPIVSADIEVALAYGFVSQNAYPEAAALFGRALARATTAGDIRRQAAALAGRGYVHYVQNQTDDAWREALGALGLWKRHPSEFSPSQAAAVLTLGASTLSYVRTTDPAPREYFRACLGLSAAFPRDVAPEARAKCLVGLATSYTIIDSRYEDAAPLLQEAIAIQRADPTAASALSTALQMHGMVNRYLGRFDEDERAQRESYEILARIHGPDQLSALWQRAVWITSLGGVNRHDEAYRESQAVLTAARGLFPARGAYMLWTPLFSATSAACLVGRYAECETLAREAVQTLGPTPPATDPRRAAARGFLGVALAQRGRCDEAKPLIQEAIEMNRARKRTPPYAALLDSTLATCKPGR